MVLTNRYLTGQAIILARANALLRCSRDDLARELAALGEDGETGQAHPRRPTEFAAAS